MSFKRRQAGFTLMELLIVVAIIGIISAVAVPALAQALARARRNALFADGKTLYSAFIKYDVDLGSFPSTSGAPATIFNPTTLAPLSTRGYLSQPQAITGKLMDGQVTVYEFPSIAGTNTQFWAILTHKYDPSLTILVAYTNQYPDAPGTWYDGVYQVQILGIAND